MDESFLITLDALREMVNVPLKITSAYRTFERNLKVGGAPNSAHLKGMAVDIACSSSDLRYAIVRACIKLGISRIGIAKTFIHIDTDTTLPQNVIWLY